MGTLLTDLRHALRRLREAPALSGAAILCIGLGVGANVAIFSVVRTVLLRPLPFAHPEELVVLSDSSRKPDGEGETVQVAPQNFLRWRERSRAFSSLEAVAIAYTNLTGDGEPLRLRSAQVTAGLFPLLGVRPLLGRTLAAEEDRPGFRAPVVVLSHAFWRAHFAADPQVIGRTIVLNGVGHRVVGVMPSGFSFPEGKANPQGPAIWLPLGLDPGDRSKEAQWHTLIVPARLARGVALAQAKREMEGIAGQLAHETPQSNEGWGVAIEPLQEELVGDLRPVLTFLMCAVGLLLSIVCVNVANLQIARSLARRHELAIRMALGAGRARLAREAFLESLLLSLLGGVCGLAIARLAIPLLLPLNPTQLSAFAEVRIDGAVLAYAALVALAVGALFGIAPSLRATRVQPGDSLREGGRSATRGIPGRRVQAALVVAEVALAVVLIAGADVLLKGLLRLQQVDPGFDVHHLLTMGMILPESAYPGQPQRRAFVGRMLERIASLPGVEAAGTSLALPMGGPIKGRFLIEGRAEVPGEMLVANHRLISPRYLETMRIPLLAGRLFTASDDASSPGVAIISKELARRYWGRQSPLGRRVKRWSPAHDNPWLTVIGVVGDVRDAGLDAEVEPTWYLPYTQHDFTALRLVVRTAGDPLAMAGAVRSAVHGIDRNEAVYDVMSMDDLLAGSLLSRRFSTLLVTLFAILGLALMIVGVYGVMSHLVQQRVHEMGIRLALGSGAQGIVALILREGMLLILVGLALGAAGSALLTRLLASVIAGLAPADLGALLRTSTLLVLCAAAAILVPTRRVTRLDPANVLRS